MLLNGAEPAMLKNGIDALELYGLKLHETIVARLWSIRWHELVSLRVWGLRLREDVIRAPGVVKAQALRVEGVIARGFVRLRIP